MRKRKNKYCNDKVFPVAQTIHDSLTIDEKPRSTVADMIVTDYVNRRLNKSIDSYQKEMAKVISQISKNAESEITLLKSQVKQLQFDLIKLIKLTKLTPKEK